MAGYAIAAMLLGLALWMTQSRTAYAGAVIGLAAVWIYSRRASWTIVAVSAAGAAALLTWGVFLNQGSATQSSASLSMSLRGDMAKIALQVAKERPIFGVGLGEFRVASRQFVTPELEQRFPATVSGENAHNNFLQVLAELGIVGFAAFAGLLIAAAWSVKGANDAGAERHPQIALAGGVVAFLVTCIGGHPLLTAEVLWMFLLALGAMVALDGRDAAAPPPTSSRRGTLVPSCSSRRSSRCCR